MEQTTAPESTPEQPDEKKQKNGCVVLAVFGFIFLAIIGNYFGWFGGDSSDNIDSNLKNGAYQTAKTAVKSELTRPSTADFSLWSTDFQKFSDKVYRVSGTVKAKNGFGTEQEFSYKVTMTYWGGDPMNHSSWEVTGCSVTPK